ncbi:Flagellar M-ring protein [Roseivivax sp. THAF40]|uniref:flagellar basal-body MS-ring/collar protein FliF n=1 Tax=Roseivivax sp. THAF40 TaxID=2587858 RepID=UPI0012682265|nr:flagellar basal-body MS-ring/collar protein FliF [Roseivivax sp. THAF40]QFT47378.1 Flagellar M-ring protein [Roseivivax sp. THAF40]
MQELKNNLFALGKTRLTALAATGLGVLLLVFFGVGSILAPTYRTLYADLEPASASRIVSTLEQAGFSVTLDSSGRVVSVPASDIARARMALADQGLPSQGSPGWEIFDNNSGLGMNSFMQRVNRLRALEGELARSIKTIDGVDAGRVHLVLPEREAFSNTRPEPSASVIIQSRAGYSLSRRQAMAIRALVASAVPDMAANRVTVLSASGETILSDDGEAPGDVSIAGMQATLEERLSKRVSQLLAARLGTGNVRVETSVDLTTERQVIREQSYDPDQQVVRSTESNAEEREGSEAAPGEVGVANDIPPELGGSAETARSSNRSSQTNEIINYEIGSTTSETVREPGDIERISVAVLVNGLYEPDANGTPVYRDRTPEELEQIDRLVRSAIGYNEVRGDLVSVESMEFVAFERDGLPIGQSALGDFLARDGNTILRGVFALAVVIAVLFLAVRPALRRALPEKTEAPDSAQLDTAAGVPSLPAQQKMPQILQQPARQAIMSDGVVQRIEPSIDALLYDDEPGDLITLASVRGGVRKRRVQSVGDLVDAEPDESMRVLKHWLAEA